MYLVLVRRLGFNGSSVVELDLKSKGMLGESIKESNESLQLLIEKNPGGLQSQDQMLVAVKRRERQRPKIGKSKKAPKSTRPPKGPNLDAVDMKLVKENPGGLQSQELFLPYFVAFNLIKPMKFVKLSITLSLSSDLLEYVIGDGKRLMQVILNVVGML